ncbi:unnamed protein product [Durusdinium trenchii]|uniref:Uncharacterized protein n=1 Tax=Durusdinium trenchii TaxID=1381693 RepID=A0ABP0K9A5_9DINO
MALKKAIYVSMGLLVGSCVGYCLDVLVMGSVAGAMCGIWMALMFHLFDLPSRPSTKSRPLVQTPEQGLVKQWTKEEKQTPQEQMAPSQERPTHLQRFRNNRKVLDKSNHMAHMVHKHEKHEKHI